MSVGVLEPTNVEVVSASSNFLACEAAEAPFFALIDAFTGTVTFAAIARFKRSKVLVCQGCAFAECWHVGPQIVDPDFLSIPRVSRTTGKK